MHITAQSLTGIATTIIILCLSACGFHLRGAIDLSETDKGVFYIADSAAPKLADTLMQQLKKRDAKLSDTLEQADYIIQLSNEDFSREILSIDVETGKASEYNLTLTVALYVTNKDQETLMEKRTLEVSRRFTSNEDAILAQRNEEEILRQDMLRQAAELAMKNIRIVTNNNSRQTKDDDQE